ncbi:MAG TPA: mechanosensitive ion channel domain-containing protein [Geminicoccaceae bacterium]|nr:mechanosensitive ion channel domain-containing protein [Geminicoccaceae bacterium]
MTRSRALIVLPALLAVLLLAGRTAAAQSPAAPAPTGSLQELAAPAASQPPATPGPAELESLIETLEDPARRDQLIATLRLLQESQAEEPPSPAVVPEQLVTGLLEEMTTRTEMVRRVSSSILASFDQIPLLFDWLQAQLSDPVQRSLWLSVGLRVAASIGFAAFAYLGVAMSLRPVRRRLGQYVEDSTIARLFRLLLVFLVDLLPVLSFVLAILAVALFVSFAGIRPSAEARAVAQPLIQAVILARLSVALARLIFAPKAPKLRLLPIADAAAIQAFRWTRALTGLTIYGYLALQAARALGLPWTLHGFLLHLLFFVVVVMVIALIVRSRAPVAHALASLGEEPHGRVVRRLPWRGLAGVWHLLAASYVVLVFAVWALKIPGGFQLLFGATLGSVLIGLGCWVALRLINQLFGRDRLREPAVEAPPSAVDRRLDRYLPVVGGVLRALVWIAATVMLLQVWGFGTLHWLLSDGGQILGGHLIMIGLIVVVTIVVWEVVSLAIERSITGEDEEGNLRFSNRTRTLLNIVRNFLLVFLSLIALFLILSELGLNIAPLLAGAGVIGLAIGFGSQKLVQDIITGMFVLLGDTMRIGDVVQVASRTGVVEEMTMRTVVLREYSGNVHTIPYSAIDTVTNFTKDFSYAVFDIGVAYRENVDQVMEVLREIGAEMNRDPNFRRLILEPLDVAGVDRFADSAVIIRARLKTRPLKQWEVSREFNRRLKNRFDELGIEIPFPHQTVYFGVDKEGRAPPVKVVLEGAPAAAEEPSAPSDQTADPQPMLARSRGG